MIEIVFDDLCIGCQACVAVCPTHVFDVGADGRPVIAHQDQCQTCFICELYCEAGALYVGADQRGPEPVDPAAVRASGQLGRVRRDYGWDPADPSSVEPGDYWRLGPLLGEGAAIAAARYDRRPAALSSLTEPDQP